MTSKGMDRYDRKDRRRVRRRNHIAKDFGSGNKYHQRAKEGKKPPPPEPEIEDYDDYEY